MNNSLLRRIGFVEFCWITYLLRGKSKFGELLCCLVLFTFSTFVKCSILIGSFTKMLQYCKLKKKEIVLYKKISLNFQWKLDHIAVQISQSYSITNYQLNLTLNELVVWEGKFEQYWRVILKRRLISLEATMWSVTSDTISCTSILYGESTLI